MQEFHNDNSDDRVITTGKSLLCNIFLWLTLPRFELNVVNGDIRTESRTCFFPIKQDLNNICYKIKGCQSISRKASIINKIKKNSKYILD